MSKLKDVKEDVFAVKISDVVTFTDESEFEHFKSILMRHHVPFLMSYSKFKIYGEVK